MVEFLLLDLDDTILDFHQAESVAIRRTLEAVGISATDENCARYSYHNKCCWERLERGELCRDRLMTERFELLIQELGCGANPAEAARLYPQFLSQGHWFLPGAQEALETLSKKYRLYLVTNGNGAVQAGRLASADIGKYFEKIFISQELGADKPSKAFFDRAFSQIPDFDRGKAMIVGDSLTSDILGGINAGIATCWVNTRGVPSRADIQPDYVIDSLSQLESVL